MHQLACALALVISSTLPALAELRLQKADDPRVVLTIPEDGTAQIRDADGNILVSGRTRPFGDEGIRIIPDGLGSCGLVRLITRPNGFTIEPLYGEQRPNAGGTCLYDRMRGTYLNYEFFSGRIR